MYQDKKEVEIDLLQLVKNLWDNKKFIIKASIIGVVIGVAIAFSIPKEYTTTVTLVSKSGKSAGGNMGTLASMAGINLGSNLGDEIFSPELYSDVLNSTPFVQGLLDINVSDTKQGIDTDLYTYIKDKQKIAWWSYVLKVPSLVTGLFKSDEEIVGLSSNNKHLISEEEMGIINALINSYSINTDKKSGVTALTVTTQSPVISADLVDTLTSYLQLYIIEQRTKKAKTDLVNSEKLYAKAKDDYYKVQQNLASFVDGNMNITSAKYKVNQDRLHNETQLAYSVYNQMAQQVQMNKIKIQDETPVFTIIQPPIEPLYPEKPKKKIIVIAFIFLAFCGSCGWILGKDLIPDLLVNKKIK